MTMQKQEKLTYLREEHTGAIYRLPHMPALGRVIDNGSVAIGLIFLWIDIKSIGISLQIGR